MSVYAVAIIQAGNYKLGSGNWDLSTSRGRRRSSDHEVGDYEGPTNGYEVLSTRWRLRPGDYEVATRQWLRLGDCEVSITRGGDCKMATAKWLA